MNILDENILEDQRQLLRNWRVPLRQIGYEAGWKGMQDEEIISFLLGLRKKPRPLMLNSTRVVGVISSS